MILHLTRPHRNELMLALPEPDLTELMVKTRDPAALSRLGYASIAGETAAIWPAARAHLATREVFPRDRDTFFYYPWQLYGIALGIQAHAELDREGGLWLREVLEQSAPRLRDSAFQHRLALELAAHICGAELPPSLQVDTRRASLGELAAAIWVRAQVGTSRVSLLGEEVPEATLLDRAIREGVLETDAVSRGFILVGLHEVLLRVRRAVGEALGSGAARPGQAQLVNQTFNIHAENAQVLQNSLGSQRR